MRNNPVLPVSDPPVADENDIDGKGVDDRLFKGSAMTKRGSYAALSYMACAVMLVLFNKAALSSYDFPCVNVITLFQMASSSLFLYALRRRKIISFTAADSFSNPDNASTLVPLKTLLHTLPLAISYLLYMLASMASVRGVNVPMYTTLRRTTVAFTMVIEYMLTGQRYTRSIIGSVGVILLGAFFAGARDLSFDFYGYGIVFVANIATAVYLATIARSGITIFPAFCINCFITFPPAILTPSYPSLMSGSAGKTSGLNSFGLMWCNGIICGPILMIWTFICGDLEKTMNFPHILSPGFMAVLFCSCVLAFFLNYCIFLNTTLNSALTQTICGNMKDLFTVGLGWMLFGGLPFDLMNVIGQLLGFFGSGLYAYYKIIGR